MLARPMQEIRIKGIQDRRSTKQARRPWIVRLTIDGRERSKSFRTRAEADRYRVLLLQAAQAGERFDSVSGEPCAWRESMRDWPVHRWVRHWVSEQWPEWQPRTRASALEALARFVSLAVSDDARVPTDLRRYLERTLAASDANQLDDALEEWLDSHALSLMECTRDVLVGIDRRLALRLDGEFLASSTAKRYRNVARACLRGAVSAGAIDADPWPAWSRARAQRKVVRARGTINVRSLPEPSTMARAIDAIETHQPGSKTYKVMTAVAYYAGLRPSEVVMLRRRSLYLEGSGWGALEVTEADISYDEPGEPKTGSRRVPVPPILVEMLRQWIDLNEVQEPADLVFRTRSGRRPSPSNWSRAWRRALTSIGEPPLRVYDCRHACATTWLRAGVPLGETARRLGHRVDTLVSTYVGALDGDERIANERIEAVLSPDS